MQQGRPMQHTAPAMQHAPAARAEADVPNSATAEKTFKSLVFIYLSLKSKKKESSKLTGKGRWTPDFFNVV
jgi:hypothetical protein